MTAPKLTFNHEFKIPLTGYVDCGLVGFILKITAQGEVKSSPSSFSVTAKKNELKGAWEKSLVQGSDKLKGQLAVKASNVKLSDVAIAIRERSPAKFIKAFLGAEATLKGEPGWTLLGGAVTWEGGAEAALQPILLKGAWQYDETLRVPDPVVFTTKYGAAVNIGPSLKGWGRLGQLASQAMIRQFLSQLGLRATLQSLIASGLLTGLAIGAGAVGGAFALLALTALYAAHRGSRGELAGLSSYYVSAYSRKVRNVFPPAKGPYRGNVVLRDEMIARGEADAVSDAKTYVDRARIQMEHPREDYVLCSAYWAWWIDRFGTQEAAQWQLEDRLWKYMRITMGLPG